MLDFDMAILNRHVGQKLYILWPRTSHFTCLTFDFGSVEKGKEFIPISLTIAKCS